MIKIRKKIPEIRYAGCLVQNNFGDKNDKGFLIWEIRGKNDFDCRHIQLKNPHPFINVDVDNDGNILTGDIPLEARLRIVSDYSLTYEQTRKVADYLSYNFKPHSVHFAPKINLSENKLNIITNLQRKNLRDISVQEELISQFLKPNNLPTEMLNKVFELNKKYNIDLSQQELVQRNCFYEILDFEWSNFFNYGENNKIEISKLKDVVGLFANNASGKSSFIEALVFTIFSSTAKNTRKLIDLVNYTKEFAIGKVRIKMDDKIYVIERKLEKYDKKTKSGIIQEAKCLVDFKVLSGDEEISLNGDTTPKTDENIRKIFGTIDDFILTQFSSQFGSLAFIEEGSTKRKEIVSKFLDIDFLEQKHDLAKEDANFIKKSLKEFEDKDFLKQIDETKEKLEEQEQIISLKKETKRELEEQILSKKQEISSFGLVEKPIKEINFDETEQKIGQAKNTIQKIEKENVELKNDVEKNAELLKKGNAFLENNDLISLKNRKDEIEEVIEEFRDVSSKEKEKSIILSGLQKEIKLLDEVPCGTLFPTCKFIKSAHEAKESISLVELALKNIQEQKKPINLTEEQAKIKQIDEKINKINNAVKEINKIEKIINDGNNRLSKNFLTAEKANLQLKELEGIKKEFLENQELYRTSKERMALLGSKKEELSSLEAKNKELERELEKLYVFIGSLKQSLKTLFENYQKRNELKEQFDAYEYYLKCFHSNGIPFEIIKSTLNALNAEIKTTLSKFVKFDVYFETDDNKLNIIFNKGNYPVPIENCSGAEKTISAFAIRLALTSLSTLPKTSLFILDEPAESLDKNYLDAFLKILEIIKEQFKAIVLISHLDALKEIPSSNIEIAKINGFAMIRA
jgi:DNA repair exonuclease SbcCD ATPase subunit